MQFRAEINKVDTIYEENFWGGKREVIIDGVKLEKIERRIFVYQDKKYKLKGSFLTQVRLVNLEDDKDVIEILPRLTIWQFILCLFPLILIIPGGFFAGVFSLLAWVASAIYIRYHEELVWQIILPITSIIFWCGMWFLICELFLPWLGSL